MNMSDVGTLLKPVPFVVCYYRDSHVLLCCIQTANSTHPQRQITNEQDKNA